MRKFSAVAALLVCLSATPSFAMDCQKEFRVRVDAMMAEASKSSSLSDAIMVNRTRFALQGYDACMKGDMNAAKDYFAQAGKSGN
ncbi:MAG: hypothetical protein SGJ17_12680 [Hyphomicrobiales bacterium]|mgnify:CR=1 FL=1|nr:hypothetical protein [Hyphomicrobiales bacterium]